MLNDQIKDYTLRITQANSSELVVIIYELAIDCIKQAESIKDKKSDDYTHMVSKAERYVGELMHGLNINEKLAQEVMRQYILVHRLLLKSRLSYDETALCKAREILEGFLPGFKHMAEEDKDDPIMKNAQKVYEGLTYGKNCKNNTTISDNSNRGYII